MPVTGFDTFDFFDDFNSELLDEGVGQRWQQAVALFNWIQQDGTTGYVAERVAGAEYRILKSSFTGSDYV